jgi:hypothetical protein
MRWENLFEDLEAQLRAEEQRELSAEVADRTRRERALIGMSERLLAHLGSVLTVRSEGGLVLSGALLDVGAGWLLLGDPAGAGALVATGRLVSVDGLESRARAMGAVARRFGMGAALRAVSRDRAVVLIETVGGERVSGTIDAVGADLLDLAEHPLDLPRRPENVLGVRAIPFSAICAVRRG